jgi:hypothetical protein
MRDYMDDETMSMLQTVCAAGGVRAGFNGDANARLEQLVEEGLLAEANPPNTKQYPIIRRRFYRPTKKGVTIVEMLKARGAGAA